MTPRARRAILRFRCGVGRGKEFRNMNRIGKVAAGAGLGLALWVAPAMGQSDFVRPVGPPGAGRCAENLARALQLTSTQQTTLDALREETGEAIRPVIEQLHDLREQ